MSACKFADRDLLAGPGKVADHGFHGIKVSPARSSEASQVDDEWQLSSLVRMPSSDWARRLRKSETLRAELAPVADAFPAALKGSAVVARIAATAS